MKKQKVLEINRKCEPRNRRNKGEPNGNFRTKTQTNKQ